MNKTGMLIRFTARPGQRDALAAHLLEASTAAHDEPETELFVVYTTPSDPSAVYVLETYSSAQGFAAHDANPRNISAKARTNEFLAGRPEVMPLAPVGGKGLLPERT